MNLRYFSRLLLLPVLVASGCHVANARAETEPATNITREVLGLEQAIALALRDNPGLRATASRIGVASGQAEQARLWPNPELELSTEEIPLRRGSFSDSKNLAGVAQTLPFPGKKRLDRQIGAQNIHFSEAEYAARRIQLTREVKIAFYQALTAEQSVAIAKELADVAENSAATARKRVEAGAAPDQEQLRAEIQWEQAKSELAEFQSQWQAARQTLATLMGRPEMPPARLTGALRDQPKPALLQITAEQWLTNHPSLVAARTAVERARLAKRRARLEPYPDVTLAAAGGRQGPEDAAIVEFSVSVPLPIIDRSKGKAKEAQANIELAEAELASTEQELLDAWQTATRQLRTAAEQVTSYREHILPKSEAALRMVRTGFEHGKFTFIDFLDTQRTTAEARLASQQRLLDLNIAQARLEALLAPALPSPPSTTSTHHE